MKTRFLMVAMWAVLLVSASAQAQVNGNLSATGSGTSTLFTQPKGFLDALFDPARFSMSQSYSMTVGSVGKYGFNQGLYLNTMTWQVADPLLMQIRVGYAHQPLGQSALFGQSQPSSQLFLQQAYLEYKPFKNAKLTFEYQSMPSSLYWTSPFGLENGH